MTLKTYFGSYKYRLKENTAINVCCVIKNNIYHTQKKVKIKKKFWKLDEENFSVF